MNDVVEVDVPVESEASKGTKQKRQFNLPSPEPWPEAVDVAEVLDEVSKTFSKYVALPDGAADVLAVWAAHTHVFEAFQHTPRLNITSPVRECGKTLLLDVLETVTPRALRTENVTVAVVFRLIDQASPTVLLDECDSYLKGDDELRGTLNAGHKRGGQHLRCEGDSHEVKPFKTFAPVALAGIGALSGTLASRSIFIRLKRATKGEVQGRFDSRHTEHEQRLNRKLARWAEDHIWQLGIADPNLPADLFNRAADNWRPLFAIVEAAGDGWPDRLKQAYHQITKGQDDETAAGVMLLEDMQLIFEKRRVDRISSVELAETLEKMEERPWGEWGRSAKPITPRQIARLLKDFGIKPGSHRSGNTVFKGYLLDDLKDAFGRYLGDRSVTELQTSNDAGFSEIPSVTQRSDVTDQICPRVAPNNECNRVTD